MVEIYTKERIEIHNKCNNEWIFFYEYVVRLIGI